MNVVAISSQKVLPLVLAGMVGIPAQNICSVEMPPFAAYGTVSCELFGPDRQEPRYTSQAEALFVYSNGCWEIQIAFKSPPEVAGYFTTCKKIPEGVRYVTVPAGRSNTSPVLPALAKPMPFPPAEEIGQLACWLSLCPDPELPLLDAKRMRMFISSDLMPHARNRCAYSASYLKPQNIFLSTLYITNSGVAFRRGPEPVSYQPPFDDGFLEFSYEVLETTNFNGVQLPSRTCLKTLGVRNSAKTRWDLYEASVQGFQLHRVISLENGDELPRLGSTPSVMFGLDRRPPALPKDITVNYLLTNDQWVATTNPGLVARASMMRQLGRNSKSASPVYLFCFLAAVALFPAAAWLVTRKIKKRNEKS